MANVVISGDTSGAVTLSAPAIAGTTTISLPATTGTMATTADIAAAIPAGSVMSYAGSAAPSGWLLSFGQAISRSTYASLFAAIGTTYGAGDGSTTFNVPDLRGYAVRGVDNMGGVAANRITSGGSGITGTTLGATGGAQTVTLTTTQIPSHTHTATGAVGTAGGSTRFSVQGSTGSTATTNATGSDGAHNNTGPTIMLNYIIKT